MDIRERQPFQAVRMLVLVIALAGSVGEAAGDRSEPVFAQPLTPILYDTGSPTLADIWVDPVSGNDASSGASRPTALRTVTAAWNRIPRGQPLSGTGYRILLVAGVYPEASVPVFWESRYGTFQFPIIIQSADGPSEARLPTMNIFDCRYLYLMGISVEAQGGDVLHFEQCDTILLRQVRVRGADPATFQVQETLKINQSQRVYIEDSDISGAWDNAVDMVAVQFGHVHGNRIHNAGDWCMYAKGGSAYLRIEANELFDCGTGGFTAGQGTGFQFMTSPWLHYEAYDLKVINNVIHDTRGAGLGVNGGYNILLGHNTLYRVGSTSHVLELTFGSRSCDGQPGQPGRERCNDYLRTGGWGTIVDDDGTNFVRIPNRNVFVYNNVVYNPPGFPAADQHFFVPEPFDGPSQAGSNVAVPTRADDNLRIRGNVIWNGPANHPLGLGDVGQGCPSGNTACNRVQILEDNAINTLEPQLVNPAGGDFRPVPSGTLFAALAFSIPPFPGGDRPGPPVSAPGNLENAVPRDRDRTPRAGASPPGAYAGVGTSSTPTPPPTTTPIATATTQTATPTPTGQSPETATVTPTTCPLRSQGDANCDGRYTLSDYTVWRSQFLGTDTALTADFNGDGRVTLADYTIWRNSFLSTASSESGLIRIIVAVGEHRG